MQEPDNAEDRVCRHPEERGQISLAPSTESSRVDGEPLNVSSSCCSTPYKHAVLASDPRLVFLTTVSWWSLALPMNFRQVIPLR